MCLIYDPIVQDFHYLSIRVLSIKMHQIYRFMSQLTG